MLYGISAGISDYLCSFTFYNYDPIDCKITLYLLLHFTYEELISTEGVSCVLWRLWAPGITKARQGIEIFRYQDFKKLILQA